MYICIYMCPLIDWRRPDAGDALVLLPGPAEATYIYIYIYIYIHTLFVKQ